MKTKNVIDVKPHSLHEEIDNNKHDDELPNHGDSLNESIKDETTPAKSSGESRKRFDRSDGEKGWTMWQWNPPSRGVLTDVITVMLKILPVIDISQTFHMVLNLISMRKDWQPLKIHEFPKKLKQTSDMSLSLYA